MIELTQAPAVPVWPPQSPDKRTRTVRMVPGPNGKPRAESLSEIAAAEKITFDKLIELNFGVTRGNPSGDRWARIINWYLKNKLNGALMADGNFRFNGGETIYLPPPAAAVQPGTPDTPLQAQAKMEVDAFLARPLLGRWADIHRSELGDDLKTRINDPSKINQANIGCCPSASVIYAFANANVLDYARLVMDLYDYGRGRINQLVLEPCQALLNFKGWREKGIRPVDWIAMSSLRDNVLDLHGSHSLGDFDGTFVPFIVDWLKRAGYTTVEDGSRLLGNASAINLDRARDLYSRDYQVIMFINAAIMDGEVTRDVYTTHVVVLASPIQYGVDADGDQTVSFTVFTWGKNKRVLKKGSALKLKDFLQGYYGFLACRF